MLSTIMDLLQAGAETTGTTLKWGILYLALNPSVQEKVRKEIVTVG